METDDNGDLEGLLPVLATYNEALLPLHRSRSFRGCSSDFTSVVTINKPRGPSEF